jgi:hypothetical protein
MHALLTILCLASAWARELTNMAWAFPVPAGLAQCQLAQLLLSLLDWQLFLFIRAIGSSKVYELGGSPAKPVSKSCA